MQDSTRAHPAHQAHRLDDERRRRAAGCGGRLEGGMRGGAAHVRRGLKDLERLARAARTSRRRSCSSSSRNSVSVRPRALRGGARRRAAEGQDQEVGCHLGQEYTTPTLPTKALREAMAVGALARRRPWGRRGGGAGCTPTRRAPKGGRRFRRCHSPRCEPQVSRPMAPPRPSSMLTPIHLRRKGRGQEDGGRTLADGSRGHDRRCWRRPPMTRAPLRAAYPHVAPALIDESIKEGDEAAADDSASLLLLLLLLLRRTHPAAARRLVRRRIETASKRERGGWRRRGRLSDGFAGRTA